MANNNEYDDIVKELFPQDGFLPDEQPVEPPPEAPIEEPAGPNYDDIVGEQMLAQKENYNRSMYLASKKKAEEHARIVSLADKAKLPPDLVERNYDRVESSFKKGSAANEYDDMLRKSPALVKWLQDKDNAGVAHDDLEALSKVEQGIRITYKKDEPGFLASSLSNLAYGMNQANALVAKTPGFLLQSLYYPQNMALGALGMENRKVHVPESWINNPISKHYESLAKAYETPELSKSITEQLAGGNWEGAGKSLVAQVLSNSPQQAIIILSALTGNVAPGLTYAGATTAAGKYAETIDPSNKVRVSPETAMTNALTHGTIEAGFESLGTFGVLKEWEKAIASKYGKQAAGELFKSFAKTLGYSMMAEGNEEGLTSVAQDFSDYITGVNPKALEGIGQRALDAGLIGAASGGAITSPSAIISSLDSKRIYVDTKNATSSMVGLEALQEVGDVVKNLKNLNSVPERLRELVSMATDGDPAAAVYFQTDQWDNYWNKKGISPAKMASELQGDDGAKYIESKQQGTQIEVPIESFVEKTGTTEHYDGLLEVARTTPDGMTLSEAQDHIKRLPVLMNQVSELATKEAEPVPETPEQVRFKSSVTQIKDNITSQLVSTGKYSSADARANAELTTSFFKTMAERTGVDPLELFNRYNLRVGTGKEQAGKKVYSQAAKDGVPAISPIGFYSQVESEISKMDFKTMPAKDLLSRIKNIQGIKKEELDFLGLEDFLSAKEGKISKDEISNFVKQNGLQVEQIVLGPKVNRKIEAVDNESQWGEDPDFSEPEYIEPSGDYIDDIVSNNWRDELYEINKGRDERFNELLADEIKEKQEEIDSGETSEEEIKKDFLEQYEKDFYDRESEYVASEEAGYGEYKITENTTDEELTGSDDQGEWYWEPGNRHLGPSRGKSYSGNMEEAKIKWMDDLYEYGYLKRPEQKPSPSEIGFKENEIEVEDEKFAELEAKIKESDEYKAKIIEITNKVTAEVEAQEQIAEERGYALKDIEQRDKEKARRINRQVERDVEKYISDTMDKMFTLNSPEATYTFEIEAPEAIKNHDSDFEFSIKGNNVNGWELAVSYLDNESDRRTDREDLPRGTTLEQAKERAQAILNDIGYTYGYEKPTDAPVVLGSVDPFAEINKPTGTVKWKDYSVVGKSSSDSNYREILLTLPKLDNTEAFSYSTHFNEKNFVAHARISDAMVGDKKTMFIEEIQSDWHQQGRDRGYATKERSKKIKDLREQIYAAESELEALRETGISTDTETYRAVDLKRKALGDELAPILEMKDPVPDAPLKQTDAWAALVMKRLVRLAAEQGYDKIAWSPSSVHVERWGTDNVSWAKTKAQELTVKKSNGVYEVLDKKGNVLKGFYSSDSDTKNMRDAEAYAKEMSKPHWLVGSAEQRGGNADGVNVEELARQRGELLERKGERVTTKEELSDVISSTLSRERSKKSLDSLTDRVWKMMQSGEAHDGRVEPRKEGMEFFYDKLIPDVAKKLVSKIDKAVKIEPVEIEGLEGKALSFDVSEKMKNAVLTQGFPLFQGGENSPLGQFFRRGNDSFINILENANPSTFLHESGHFFLEVFGDLAQSEGASQQVKDEFSAALKWLGVESRDQIKREHHEKWAEGFEVYLREGKAPSLELQGLFARFRIWLISVYKDLINKNVKLTPEVRAVMDRLLATDNEIAEARGEPFLDTKTTLGMNDEAAFKYLNATLAVEEEANAQVLAKIMKDIDTENRQIRKEREAAIRNEIESQANELPVYKALALMQQGKQPNGSALPDNMPMFKLERGPLIAQFGEDIVKKLPRGVVLAKGKKQGGLNHNLAAELFKYSDSNSFINELVGSVSKDQLVDSLVQKRMIELYPDQLQDGSLKETVVEKMHNEKKSTLLRMEYDLMVKHHAALFKDMIKRAVRALPSDRATKAEAKRTIAKKELGQLKPHLFLQAERRARKQAGEALVRGEWEKVFDLKELELLNHELYSEAIRAKDNVQDSISNFKEIAKVSDKEIAKTRDTDLASAAKSILATFGIGKQGKAPSEYLKMIKQYDPDAFQTIEALVESVLAIGVTDLKKITYEQFQTLNDSVEAIWELAKTSREMTIDGKKVDRELVKQELIQVFNDMTPEDTKKYQRSATDWEKTKNAFLGAISSLRMFESWVDAVDGVSKIGEGVVRKYLKQPIFDAALRYKVEKKKLVKKYLDIVKKYEGSITQEDIVAPELVDSETGKIKVFAGKAELRGFLIHLGNESNMQKLVRGFKWGEYNEDGTLDRTKLDAFLNRAMADGTITKQDIDFAQEVWDLFEGLKPNLQKAHKDLYGFYFNEVEAAPFVTPFGTYRGGYAPAKADPSIVSDAAIRDERAALEPNNSFSLPSTGKGATMSRVEGYAAPLQLGLNFIPSHIDWAMRFTHIQPVVKEVSRLLFDKEFVKALDAFDPTVRSEMLIPWLSRVATQQVVTRSKGRAGAALDRFFTAVRKRTGLQAMAVNVTNAFQNVIGLSLAAVKVKPKFLKDALYTYIKAPKDTAKDVSDRSEFMKNLMDESSFEMQKQIDDILTEPTKMEKLRDFAEKNSRVLQAMTQNTVGMITWMGAYNQAIAEGVSEPKAVNHADETVRLTQSDSSPESLTRLEANTAFVNMFLQFYRYFNMWANLLGTEFIKVHRDTGLRKGAGRALYIYAFGMMIPSVVNELLTRAMSGKGFDDEGEDEYPWLSLFFGSQTRSTLAMIPGVGSALTAGLNAWNKKPYDDRISTSPAISMIESSVKAPHSVYKAMVGDGSKRAAVRDTLTALGLLSGLPLLPLAKPINYVVGVNEGQIEPSGPIDLARGLVTGKGGKE